MPIAKAKANGKAKASANANAKANGYSPYCHSFGLCGDVAYLCWLLLFSRFRFFIFTNLAHHQSKLKNPSQQTFPILPVVVLVDSGSAIRNYSIT